MPLTHVVVRDPLQPGRGVFRVEHAAGRSVVSRAFATSPLRLLTPRNHGRAAWIYTSTFGGGLVDGDAIDLEIDVGPGAAALLSSQASTKIYRSVRGTSFHLAADVRDEALLAVVPDPVVCFAGARYAQTQQFTLAGRASLVLVDWLTSGRYAAGERWGFDGFSGRIVIRRQGRLILHDALCLQPADGNLRDRLGRFDVLCTIALMGSALQPHVERLLSVFGDAPVQPRAALLAGASPLGHDGCIVRLAGPSAEAVGHVVRERLQFLPALLGDDPWTRKW